MRPPPRAGRWIRWYLKQMTGEAKWDEHLDHCCRVDIKPMSGREFERHRAEHRENNQPACPMLPTP